MRQFFEKRIRPGLLFDIFNVMFFIILSIVFLAPFIHILMYSVSDISHYSTAGLFLLPRGFDPAIYEALLLKGIRIPNALLTSLFVAISGTFLGVLISSMLAYAITKPFKGRGVLVVLIFFTMMFSGGMVPTWLVVRGLGLLDSRCALVLPGMVTGFYVFILRNFIQMLPEGLEESVLIDGGSYLTVFFKIVLPLSKPVIATVALMTAVGYWNDYFSSIIYLFDTQKWPLATLIRDLINRSQLSVMEGGVVVGLDVNRLDNVKIKSATMVISMIPVLIAYPFAQKYFERGMIIGAIKG
ncbi:MAG: carbohydrate ABC transporter permease [Clostridiales bacterium]|jgi:putative aldouronate transport system permease protein|nr:carbohydrate ABC transporter permease [Clostridiales bacterium]